MSHIDTDVRGAGATLPLPQLLSLQGRVAVVTGAARGLGLATADRLAEAGAAVVLADLAGDQAASAAASIADRHDVRAVGRKVDVSDESSVEELAAFVDKSFGSLHIWVNNAGIYPSASLTETELRMWTRTMEVNLTGAFLGSRAAAHRMIGREVPGRVIINISSVSGLRGRPGLSAYSSSKHGVIGLTRALAVELGEAGIRVLGIAPSVVDTPGMRERRAVASERKRAQLVTLEEELVSNIPLRRPANVDDVARVALFCASDLSAYMTGAVLPVDGGLTAG